MRSIANGYLNSTGDTKMTVNKLLLIIPTYLLGLISLTALALTMAVVMPYFAGVRLLRGKK